MLIDGWLHREKLIVPLQEIYDIEFEKFSRAYAGTRICRIVTFTKTLWDDFLWKVYASAYQVRCVSSYPVD